MSKFYKYYVLLSVFVALYLGILLMTPVDGALLSRYDISDTTARLLMLSFGIPLVAVWILAFVGFLRVKQYAGLAGDTRDGRAYRIIADGLMVLAISLPFNSLVARLLDYIERHYSDFVPELTILCDYLSLFLSLAGVWLIAHGARRLISSLPKRPYNLNQALLASAFTAVAFIYTYLAMTDASDKRAAITEATYYLPDYLVFATIVIPYILVWYLGLRAVYHIRQYRQNVEGVLYQKALGQFTAGLFVVVIFIITLRIATSISDVVNDLSLNNLLTILYLLVFGVGIGYWLIAAGAKKLIRIEKV